MRKRACCAIHTRPTSLADVSKSLRTRKIVHRPARVYTGTIFTSIMIVWFIRGPNIPRDGGTVSPLEFALDLQITCTDPVRPLNCRQICQDLRVYFCQRHVLVFTSAFGLLPSDEFFEDYGGPIAPVGPCEKERQRVRFRNKRTGMMITDTQDRHGPARDPADSLLLLDQSLFE
jgi:hypothetical protein